MKRAAGLVLDLVGFLLVVAGLWLLAPWLAAVVAGIGLVAAGTAIAFKPRKVSSDDPEYPSGPAV